MKKLKLYLIFFVMGQSAFAQTSGANHHSIPTPQDSLKLWYGHAESAAVSGNLDAAAGFYKKILAVDPKQIEVYDLMGKMYYDAKNYFTASTIFQEKIQKFTPSYLDYFYLGNCQLVLKSYPAADSAYQMINELKPSYAEGWYIRARIIECMESEANQSTKAQPFYEKYLELTTLTLDSMDLRTKRNVLNGYSYLVNYYFNPGENQNLPKALDYIKKGKELDPNFGELIVCGIPVDPSKKDED